MDAIESYVNSGAKISIVCEFVQKLREFRALGIGGVCIIAVFALLFIQDKMSLKEGFSVAPTLIIYILLYIDFLRKKITTISEYTYQSFNKANIGLLLYLLCNVLYFG